MITKEQLKCVRLGQLPDLLDYITPNPNTNSSLMSVDIDFLRRELPNIVVENNFGTKLDGAICAVGSVIYELEKIRRDLVNNIEDYPESQ